MAKKDKKIEHKLPKVLRLHDAPSVDTHWHKTGKIEEKEIDSIKDPAEQFHAIPVTSIPSPFARIHLTENSFQKINLYAGKDTSKLMGKTIYHKMVSETFDLAELFFNFDEFKESGLNLELLQWNIKNKITELKAKPKHELLADSLELFLKQSPELSNFNKLEDIYILKLNYRAVGGTSPSTLFFSSPNIQHMAGMPPIKLGDDILFDDEFCPLYKRDRDFIIYIYLLFEVYPHLKEQMSLVWKHLDINLSMLSNYDPELWKELKEIQNIGQNNAEKRVNTEFTPANFGGPNTFVHILPNVLLYKKKIGSGEVESDFFIGSYKDPNSINSKYQGEKLPLVLQNEFHGKLNYHNNGSWDFKTKVPYLDNSALNERTLPALTRKYPYLTVSDFLEPYLVRLPFMVDSDNFLTGTLKGFSKGDKNQNIAPDQNFALPLTKRFFEFFDIDDLKGKTSTGLPVFEIVKESSEKIKVVVRIPIKANNIYITLERTYRENQIPNIDNNYNDGAIVDGIFNIGIMPFIRKVINQRVVLLERETESPIPYEISFYDQALSTPLPIEQHKVRSDLNKGHQATSSYYDIDEDFHFIQLEKKNIKCLIVPTFPNHIPGGKSFTFAIDFGTTNTHIEYSIDGSAPKPFDISDDDAQLISMHHKEWEVTPREIQYYLQYEVLPKEIGSEFKFPTRTALAEIHDLAWGGSVMPFGDFNPALYYQKYSSLDQADIYTNLKWANMKAGDFAGKGRIRGYLETLLMMIRNKILLNSGDISRTNIIWFYPSSMSLFAKAQLEKTWTEIIETYLKIPANNIACYSESEAPFYVHAESRPSVLPMLNIDIGGGTTDISIFENETAKYHTSFKFAGNNLFGNGYISKVGLENGIVKAFSSIVKAFLDANYYPLLSIVDVFEELSDNATGKSADLISFFFSIEENMHLKNHKLKFSFSDELTQDQEFKFPFLLFHSAILYHTAKWMKALGLPMPENIFYSGNGSKTLNLIDPSRDWTMMSKVAKEVFEFVYETDHPKSNIFLFSNKKPKEATCKGGIEKKRRGKEISNSSQTVLIGNDTIVGEEEDFSNLTYKEALHNENILSNTIKDCYTFIEFLTSLNNKVKLSNFGIPVGKIPEYRKILEQSLDAYLSQGVNDRLENVDEADVIEETLFFYPLVGAIHRLILDIGEGKI